MKNKVYLIEVELLNGWTQKTFKVCKRIKSTKFYKYLIKELEEENIKSFSYSIQWKYNK